MDPLVAKAIRSLEFALCNPECEMERPSEWIRNDPDFSWLGRAEDPRFTAFLHDQEKRDYPAVVSQPGPGPARLGPCAGLADHAQRYHRQRGVRWSSPSSTTRATWPTSYSTLSRGQDHRRAARRDRPDRGQPAPGLQPVRPRRLILGLAKAYYDFDNDPSLRARGVRPRRDFSRGIDVDAFAPLAKTGHPFAVKDGMFDPFARSQHLSKPLIAVVHGDTWNMGHELHLVADIRVASADVRFGQDEHTHGRFPGGGSTIRFPQEAGWGTPCATCSPATTLARSSIPRTSSRAAGPRQKDVPPSTKANRRPYGTEIHLERLPG